MSDITPPPPPSGTSSDTSPDTHADTPCSVAIEDVPYALDDFTILRDRLDGRRPAVFLDYDGTLTPIVDRPDMAVLSDEGRAVVDRLARKLPTAVVSGRDRADVEALVGVSTVIYAGSHGFDIHVPGKPEFTLPGLGDTKDLLDRLEARLKDTLADISGALVERKKFSIAAHYRLVADADYKAFRAALDDAVAGLDGIKEKTGKKVFEFQPDIDWDKGKCVRHLLDVLGLDGPDHIPIFVGDDVTDEDAFKALQADGVGIVVAGREDEDQGRRTAAAFRVEDPVEVLELLRRLATL